MKRVKGRHGGGENAEKTSKSYAKYYDFYEPAGDDEEGTHNVTISEDMSPDDVMKLVLEKVSNC